VSFSVSTEICEVSFTPHLTFLPLSFQYHSWQFFLLSFCRLLLPVINFNFLSLFSTHRKSQLTRVCWNIVIG
jgi:hypothetical protein